MDTIGIFDDKEIQIPTYLELLKQHPPLTIEDVLTILLTESDASQINPRYGAAVRAMRKHKDEILQMISNGNLDWVKYLIANNYDYSTFATSLTTKQKIVWNYISSSDSESFNITKMAVELGINRKTIENTLDKMVEEGIATIQNCGRKGIKIHIGGNCNES